MMRTVILVAAAAVLAGCAGSMDANQQFVNVSALSPAPGARDVSPGDTVRLQMDMPMDSASCAMRFTLHRGDSLGAEVPGRVLFDDGDRRMLFIPASRLEPGMSYFAHMRDGMTMSSAAHGGNGMMGRQAMMSGSTMMTGTIPAGAIRMSDGMAWSFTTGN